MNFKKMVGLLIGFVGFIPVLSLQTGAENLFTIFRFFSWPELAMMGAALFSTYGWILLRILVKKHTLSPLYANGYSMLIGGGMALIHSLFIDGWDPIPISSLDNFFPCLQGIVFMTLISNVFCYNLYGFLLKKFTATFLSFVGLLSPVFASLSGWVLLGESPSWIIFLSTAIVVFGLFIVYHAELKQGYIVKEKPQIIVPT